MRISRRIFLKSSVAVAVVSSGCARLSPRPKRILVNDVQSRLNATYVERVVEVDSLAQLEAVVRRAADKVDPICVCGGRHAMGGQQFLTDSILLDTTRLRRVLKFDPDRGTIEVEAGIQWPELLKYLLAKQNDPQHTWTFAQKQTGADRFCLGGALGSNIHSRGLTMRPFVSDIESFTLVDASGTLRTCSRTANRELFCLAIGGYGLLGSSIRSLSALCRAGNCNASSNF